MLKRFFLSSFMVGAVVVPYAISTSGDWYNKVKTQYFSSSPQAAAPATPQPAATANGQAAQTSQAPGLAGLQAPSKPQSIEGFPATDLKEVLHFDGTPAWVMSRWPRVSSGLATLDLQGYRVPLVTGTAQDDLAGSLTYYFNNEQKVQRITFLGTTGDTRPLVNLVTSRYGLVRQQDEGPGVHLYQFRSGKKVASELRIKPARTVSLAEPHSRFEVALVLERPPKMK